MVPANNDNHGTICSTNEVTIEAAPSQVFEVLSNPVRRWVLHYFRSQETDAAKLDEIHQFIRSSTDREIDKERFKIQIHHQHLPMLEKCDIVEYDERDEMVRYFGDPLAEKFLVLVSDYDLD